MANSEQIVRELEEFYAGYIDGFNREDVDHFMQSFSLPFVLIDGTHGVTVCANEADHQRFYARTMIGLQERGWGRSGVDQLRVWPLADNLAVLMADVRRYRRDGSMLESLRVFYTLRRDGNSWKIVTISPAAPPFLGPGDIPRQQVGEASL